MADHLFLVGMMGSGKTTVARLLAEHLDRPLIDLDDEIETHAGRSIPALFADEGEDTFRRREAEALARVATSEVPSVVATGGGVVLWAENRSTLSAHGTTVLLRARPATLAARLAADHAGRRPLLGAPGDDLERRLEAIASDRASAYAEVADLVVDVDDLDAAASCQAVLRGLGLR